jgi:hypothetical protein
MSAATSCDLGAEVLDRLRLAFFEGLEVPEEMEARPEQMQLL